MPVFENMYTLRTVDDVREGSNQEVPMMEKEKPVDWFTNLNYFFQVLMVFECIYVQRSTLTA